ncbi:hypothetical protein, partial [Streptomyces sp. NPDC051776]|uniref:hypothetical protein n=1 Tax=Streptomyces sp. NPDC051776 TaxID=3155414 RepID=UPI0034244036
MGGFEQERGGTGRAEDRKTPAAPGDPARPHPAIRYGRTRRSGTAAPGDPVRPHPAIRYGRTRRSGTA